MTREYKELPLKCCEIGPEGRLCDNHEIVGNISDYWKPCDGGCEREAFGNDKFNLCHECSRYYTDEVSNFLFCMAMCKRLSNERHLAACKRKV